MPGMFNWLKNCLHPTQSELPELPPSYEHLTIKPTRRVPTPPLLAPPHPIPFQHIIGLGSDCDVALQLRNAGWLRTPSVFDWLVTPWDAMLSVLKDDGARLAQQIDQTAEGGSAVCKAYGLLYHHEFPRHQGKVQITPEAIATARAKLTHKMARLHATLSGNESVLLVRSGIKTDAPNDRFASGAPFKCAELDRCAALIATLYPNLHFTLLNIEYPGHDQTEGPPPRDPRVVRYRMPLPALGTPRDLSRASTFEWARLFRQIPYVPHPASTQSHEDLAG